MVQPLQALLALLFLAQATFVAGCSFAAPNEPHDDASDPFRHRPYTAWAPIASSDGTRLAFVLEPRRVDADSHGVFIQGWRGRVAGDSLVRRAVGDDAGRVAVTLPGGLHHTAQDAQTAYVFTAEEADWVPSLPNDMPPRASRFVSVTWLDRETLAVRGTRSFDPPLQRPIALGAGLVVDTPREGTSDVLRDIHLVAHDLAAGTARTLHEGRGFAAYSCAHGAAVTVAYRPQDAPRKTTIVDVTFDPVTREASAAQLVVDDFHASDVVCRTGGGSHAAILGRRESRATRAVVVNRKGNELVLAQDVEGGAPATLSTNGATLLAARPDGHAALFAASGVVDLPEVSRYRYTVELSAERALLSDSDGGWIVRLDGTQPASTRVTHAVARGASRSAFATGGGGFVFFDIRSDTATDKRPVVQAFAIDPSGQTHALVIDPIYTTPSLAHADATRAYLLADRQSGDRAVDILALDFASYAVTPVAKAVLCDLSTVRDENRCLP